MHAARRPGRAWRGPKKRIKKKMEMRKARRGEGGAGRRAESARSRRLQGVAWAAGRREEAHHVLSIEEGIVDADNVDLGVSGSDAGDEATNAAEAVDTNVDLLGHVAKRL